MKRTLAIIWKGNKKTVVLLLSATVVSGMMSPLILYCEQQVINAISLFLNRTSVLESVGAPFWGLIGAYICVDILPVFTELLHVKLEAASGLTFHRQLIDKMQTIRYQCVEDKEVTDLYFRIGKNIDKVIYEFMRNFFDLIAELIGVVGSFTIISSVSVISGAVFLILFVILLFFADRSAKNFYQLNQEFSETERRVVYLDSVENTKPFAYEKKLFGFTDYINHKRSSFLLSRRNAMRKYDYKLWIYFRYDRYSGISLCDYTDVSHAYLYFTK